METININSSDPVILERQTNNNFQQMINLQDDGLINIRTENLEKSFSYGTELSGNFRFGPGFF